MNVSLTPALEKFIREKTASGLYNNASEVVREALRLLVEKSSHRPIPERAAVIAALREVEPQLRKEGVVGLSLFGSVARNAAGRESDIDVLIDIDPKRRFSLLDQAGIQELLARATGHEVDVVLRSGLRRELRAAVLADAVSVF